MKTVVTVATIVFWIAIAGIALMAARTPDAPPSPAADAPSAAAAPDARYSLAEVSRHADADSCWMAIDGVVYDFTAYLPRHPAEPAAMLDHCGKEASEAFRTKDAGRPHSAYARSLLARYRVGVLAP
jgi:cytochrome b involved in lipid metabolism